jgi:peptidyl-prolyl cis-trans isomerase A (cyclophilin A)
MGDYNIPDEGTYAVMQTTRGDMVLELYADRVPNTVRNFVHLSTTGFYDDVIFHRIIEEFMVQGGDPEGTGRGGPGYRFADEFHQDLRHESAGILSMANAGPNTNGSQFFITLVPTPHLDGRHAVFGKVTEGMDVLQDIGTVETNAQDRPVEPIKIETVDIYRDGEKLTEEQPEPAKL